MNVSIAGLPGLSGAGDAAMRAAVTVAALLLGACGGSSSTGASGPDPLATCDPGVPGAVAECGSVIVSFTDADGDFLNYTVDVLSLTLQTANGRVVETLPRETRINFTDYVDLTELVTVATVPPATYVAGTIRFDYSDAEVFVAVGNGSKEAAVTDPDGTPLARAELRIRLSPASTVQTGHVRCMREVSTTWTATSSRRSSLASTCWSRNKPVRTDSSPAMPCLTGSPPLPDG